MVHCSLNDMQPMYAEGPAELVDALVELCGPDRTLAMPAFFFGGRDGDAAAYYRARPRFDVRRQPSQMGLLSEVFRRRPGVVRSVHPTHSVCALGPLAEELTAGHHLAPTTFGVGTPFGVMADRRTVIAGLGAEYFRCLTQVHAAEDLLGDEYPIALRPERLEVRVTDRTGAEATYALPVSTVRRSPRTALLEQWLAPGELTRWRFHGVRLFTTTAARVTQALVEAARAGRTLYEEPAATG
jgi:aminoglycoside 3-N-acetyltransferase